MKEADFPELLAKSYDLSICGDQLVEHLAEKTRILCALLRIADLE